MDSRKDTHLQPTVELQADCGSAGYIRLAPRLSPFLYLQSSIEVIHHPADLALMLSHSSTRSKIVREVRQYLWQVWRVDTTRVVSYVKLFGAMGLSR